MAKGKYAESLVLLSAYETAHSTNLNAIWIYAQAAYFKHDFTLSKSLYDRAVSLYPSNFYLKLDYANHLVEMQDFDKADSLFKRYETFDSTSAGIMFALAKKDYYMGNYAAALSEIKRVLSKDAGNTAAIQLLKEINEAKATWLNIGAAYKTDDQPLQSITPHVEAGTYVSALFEPFVGYSAPIFSRDGQSFNAQIAQVGNLFHFFKSGFTIKASAGFVSFPSGSASSWTGDLSLTKDFAHYLEINADVNHSPYFDTRSSLDTNVILYNYSLSIGWNNPNSWNGKLILSNSYFSIYSNNVYSISGWIFAPPLRLHAFTGRLGYAFNYSSSSQNLYTAAPSADSSAIKGVYIPYFTPNDQRIHSVLASIDYKNKAVEAGIHANAGVYARNMDPYFYFENATDDIVLKEGFASTNFFPLQVDVYALFHVAENMSLVCNYTYSHNIFYTSSYAGIALKIFFVHE